MPVPIIINGAYGKMGRVACEAIKQSSDFKLVAALGREDNLKKAIKETQAAIVIDLTRADVAYTNTRLIVDSGVSPIIGTSGLLDSDITQLRDLCSEKKLGGIIVPNFSIAAVLMMHFTSIAARWFPEVEIVEAHHPNKQDAPSGTALKTAKIIAEARQAEPTTKNTKLMKPCARGALYHQTPIHAIRLPGVLAQQQVIFGGEAETLTITHNSIDRSSFMPGLLLACRHVRKLDTLYHGLEHVLMHEGMPFVSNV